LPYKCMTSCKKYIQCPLLTLGDTSWVRFRIRVAFLMSREIIMGCVNLLYHDTDLPYNGVFLSLPAR
jgi:hypothetical protein